MLMETFTTVSGKMTKLTASAFITTLMARSTKVGGSKTNNMEKEKKFGPTTPAMKDSTRMVRSMGMVNSFGLTAPHTLGISSIITFMVQVFTLGLTVVSLTASGTTTKCTAMESSRGTMEESTKENTLMIRNRVKVFLLGQMDASTKANGRMENNTESVSISLARVKLKKVNGLMESVFSG